MESALTDDDPVTWVGPDDLFDLLHGALAGGQGAGGVAVGVVQVQHVNGGLRPQTGLTQHGRGVTEVP